MRWLASENIAISEEEKNAENPMSMIRRATPNAVVSGSASREAVCRTPLLRAEATGGSKPISTLACSGAGLSVPLPAAYVTFSAVCAIEEPSPPRELCRRRRL
ncbi:hypothetical protein JCM30237_18610 [Halolamina litorea]